MPLFSEIQKLTTKELLKKTQCLIHSMVERHQVAIGVSYSEFTGVLIDEIKD